MFIKSHFFTVLRNLIYFSINFTLTTFKIQHESIALMGKLICMTCNNHYYLIVLLQMETENVSDRSNNISVSIGLQNVVDRYGRDQKAIRYNGNIVLNASLFSSSCLRSFPNDSFYGIFCAFNTWKNLFKHGLC